MNLDNQWFLGDFHLGHEYISKETQQPRGVRFFERTQFKSMQEHDQYVWEHLFLWGKQHRQSENTLWILGDFGNVDQLHRLDELRAYADGNLSIKFIYGNHDSASDIKKFQTYCDEVYLYPQFISSRVILSHYPIWPCPAGYLNCHSHLHGAILNSNQHICASINDNAYTPFSYKKIAKQLQNIEKNNYRFLQEPWAKEYHFLSQRKGIITDKKGNIKLKETLVSMGK